MSTTITRALGNLSRNMPVANQRVAQNLQSAQDFQMQQQLSAAGQQMAATPAANVRTVAQQAGAQQAAQAGQAQTAAAQQNVQQQQQLAGLAAQETQRQTTETVGAAERAVRLDQMKNDSRIASLSEEKKSQIFGERLEFKKDEQGRAFLNERQMMDFAVANAKSEESFKKYAQMSQQMYDKKIAVMEMTYKSIDQHLQNTFKMKESSMRNAQAARLQKARQDVLAAIEKEKNKAAARAGQWQIAGTVIGAVIGTFAGGNTAAGAAIGGAAGSGLYSATQGGSDEQKIKDAGKSNYQTQTY